MSVANEGLKRIRNSRRACFSVFLKPGTNLNVQIIGLASDGSAFAKRCTDRGISQIVYLRRKDLGEIDTGDELLRLMRENPRSVKDIFVVLKEKLMMSVASFLPGVFIARFIQDLQTGSVGA